MKVSVNYILSANKQKKYIQLTKFYGYKYINGDRKQDKSRENLGWIWASPKNPKQRDFNKQRIKQVDLIISDYERKIFEGNLGLRDSKSHNLNFISYYIAFQNNYKNPDGTFTQTYQGYASSLKQLIKFSGEHIKFKDVNYKFCNDYYIWLSKEINKQGKRFSIASQNKYFNNLKFILNNALKEKLIFENPAKDVIQKKEKPRKIEYLNPDDYKKLNWRIASNQMDAKAYIFSCNTGLRISDCKKLKWKHIVVENEKCFVYLIAKKGRQGKDRGVDIKIPMSRDAIDIIGKRKKSDDFVFTNLKYSKFYNDKRTLWFRDCGINKRANFHNARHTFITNLCRADVPVELIKRLAGHSNIQTTFKYIQLVDEDKQPAIKALSDIYNR